MIWGGWFSQALILCGGSISLATRSPTGFKTRREPRRVGGAHVPSLDVSKCHFPERDFGVKAAMRFYITRKSIQVAIGSLRY